ncbi:hypothetical protein IV500_15490 [Paeniglutamicibacter antarcticus]|uniref:Uncharacterized protein n=1 Tax=Arthrobacter terrae TaxID=2935737 RepID=A0A931CM44_9MICC|nr:hypothetical protein [Arthrobacter terrae]MBG0740778.1 hypothetical protein [Arthrobacter terrae]
MDQYLNINDLLIYSGTVLIAVMMFAVIGVSFLGCLLLALAARALQCASLALTGAVVAQWSGWRAGSAAAPGPATVAGASQRPGTEAIQVLDSATHH